MIVTQRKKIPWWWLGVLGMPIMTNQFVEHCSGAALTFTMRKYISLPWLMTLLASTNILFNFLVAPVIAYQSDRIWTRFGRRKPFIVAGWIGLVGSLALVPLAPNVWTLAIVIVVYQFFEDIAFTGPWTPLFNEIVPLPQRGRASAFNTFLNHCTTLYFNFVLIGHFDEKKVSEFGTKALGYVQFVITGEQKIYWFTASLIAVMTFIVCFTIKETPVQHGLTGERFSIKRFLTSVFGERQWLIIYVLIFSQVAMNQGIATFGPLLTTEQFGYTKQQMGNIGGYVTILRMILVIPVAGYFADKLDRIRMFQTTIFLATLHHISWWGWIHFIATNQIPTIPTIVAFDIIGSFINVTGSIAMGPLLFDYVPRNRMGTVFAGMSFVRGMIKIVLLNGVGVWITLYGKIFLPEGKYDYSCAFLYTTMLGALGCATSFYFSHQRKKGRIIEYGRRELETSDASAAAPKLATAD